VAACVLLGLTAALKLIALDKSHLNLVIITSEIALNVVSLFGVTEVRAWLATRVPPCDDSERCCTDQ